MNPSPVTTDERDSLEVPVTDFANLAETLRGFGAPQWMLDRAVSLAQQ